VNRYADAGGRREMSARPEFDLQFDEGDVGKLKPRESWEDRCAPFPLETK